MNEFSTDNTSKRLDTGRLCNFGAESGWRERCSQSQTTKLLFGARSGVTGIGRRWPVADCWKSVSDSRSRSDAVSLTLVYTLCCAARSRRYERAGQGRVGSAGSFKGVRCR
ncbi:hypothetical protein POSPLADRAFT_1041962 [Postia placenta MAD-698-R-SB12]|uniref:Uncharacterized protein n=1 Tax=Postia placenta MAD-698-R-SB12 TaxID=670580 RepID=A0A1X6MJA0_9APHY|nr:hypothetical protein POSPLADRAFT_1041962 [Postia placenta MAD-698-R-SB12]OSX56454.1 hypothetical protein POSPLADRAFT_1041962 [Postia placenta MAD-698-R-SB12]